MKYPQDQNADFPKEATSVENPKLIPDTPQERRIAERVEQAVDRRRWLDGVFNSPPVREVKGRSRPTQRFAYQDDEGGVIHYQEGGNEQTASILFRYWKRLGIVRRYKPQPFNVNDLSPGINAVPDFLVELTDRRIFVIEVKARRFLSPDVLASLEVIQDALCEQGLPYRVWTDKDPEGKTNKLNRAVWGNARVILRGFAIPLEAGSKAEIPELIAKGDCVVGDLLAADACGWDQLISALARGVFFINIQDEINENSKVHASIPTSQWKHFFEEGDAFETWWGGLPDFPNH
jgi:hypothetical protein